MWCDLRLCLNPDGYHGIGGCVTSCRCGAILNGLIRGSDVERQEIYECFNGLDTGADGSGKAAAN